MRISSKDPNFPIWTRFAGNAELESAHDAAALEWYSHALALSPRSPVVQALLAGALALAGDSAQAAHYAVRFRQLTAGLSDAQRLDMLGASSKRPEEPHRLLDGCRLALPYPGDPPQLDSIAGPMPRRVKLPNAKLAVSFEPTLRDNRLTQRDHCVASRPAERQAPAIGSASGGLCCQQLIS
jgi:hypothetical protein